MNLYCQIVVEKIENSYSFEHHLFYQFMLKNNTNNCSRLLHTEVVINFKIFHTKIQFRMMFINFGLSYLGIPNEKTFGKLA